MEQEKLRKKELAIETDLVATSDKSSMLETSQVGRNSMAPSDGMKS